MYIDICQSKVVGKFIKPRCRKINTELVSLKIYKTNYKIYYKNTINLPTIMDKRLGTFLGRFPIHTGPTPPLTPQIMLDACIQNFAEFQLCIGWGKAKLQENFEKDALFQKGTKK